MPVAVRRSGLDIVDWADGETRSPRPRPAYPFGGDHGDLGSAWAMHLIEVLAQDAVPGSSYRSLTQALPMLRAVKDAAEAGLGWRRRAPLRWRPNERIPRGPLRLPPGDRRRRRPGRAAARTRA